MVDANNLSKHGESLLVIVYVLIRQLKGSQPELISEFVNSLTVTITKKMFCGWALCSLYETRATSEAETIERTAYRFRTG
jgi:hypothetical protein